MKGYSITATSKQIANSDTCVPRYKGTTQEHGRHPRMYKVAQGRNTHLLMPSGFLSLLPIVISIAWGTFRERQLCQFLFISRRLRLQTQDVQQVLFRILEMNTLESQLAEYWNQCKWENTQLVSGTLCSQSVLHGRTFSHLSKWVDIHKGSVAGDGRKGGP